MPKSYLVLDFETTGLDYKKEQVTEVGAIKYDENFNEVSTFHTYVKLSEGVVLTDFIKNLTGITEEKLEYGMHESLAMSCLSSLIDNETIVVAQYAPFDFAYLSNYNIFPKKFICTRTLTSIADGQKVSASLIPTCERLGIELNDAHTAMGDVRATTEVLKYRLGQDLEKVENILVETEGRPNKFKPIFTDEVITISSHKK